MAVAAFPPCDAWPAILKLQHSRTNPAAYLTFDEGTATVAHDSPGNNNNATLFGAAAWTTGLVGQE
jgi:hypothetical protein